MLNTNCFFNRQATLFEKFDLEPLKEFMLKYKASAFEQLMIQKAQVMHNV